MTSIATRLENDPKLRARTVTILSRLLAFGSCASLIGLASLAYILF